MRRVETLADGIQRLYLKALPEPWLIPDQATDPVTKRVRKCRRERREQNSRVRMSRAASISCAFSSAKNPASMKLPLFRDQSIHVRLDSGLRQNLPHPCLPRAPDTDIEPLLIDISNLHARTLPRTTP